MDRRRIVAVAVVLAIAWLAVWTYTSGSDATATSADLPGSSHDVTPTSGHAPKTSQHPQKAKGSTTTAGGPTTTVVANPQSYAGALFRYWESRDRVSAIKVATESVVTQLFHRRPFKNETWTAKGCAVAGPSTLCTWTSARRRFVMTVRNATSTAPVLVVGMQFLRA